MGKEARTDRSRRLRPRILIFHKLYVCRCLEWAYLAGLREKARFFDSLSRLFSSTRNCRHVGIHEPFGNFLLMELQISAIGYLGQQNGLRSRVVENIGTV